jgi:putative glycerol-1-phosphate prenyltransferase
MTVYQKLLKIRSIRQTGFFVLLDPDHQDGQTELQKAKACETCGVDALLIGGSLLLSAQYDDYVKAVKSAVSLPVILFPGNGHQISKHADAILFLSLISGRNPTYLIEEHVRTAPLIHSMGIETISTGYMLVESGSTTSVEFMSDTKPLPREKPNIAVAHALAAEYLGMKMLYLEGGSGASLSVPDEMIQAVKSSISIPVIVGGGINNPETARKKVEAGADFIVAGTILENNNDIHLLQALSDAVHHKA